MKNPKYFVDFNTPSWLGLTSILTFTSCTMNNSQILPDSPELKETDCLTDRKSINTLNLKEGEIFLIDQTNFGIRFIDSNEVILLPCNLPARFQKAGLKVVFSGALKETKMEEMWAGQPFVLTGLSEK